MIGIREQPEAPIAVGTGEGSPLPPPPGEGISLAQAVALARDLDRKRILVSELEALLDQLARDGVMLASDRSRLEGLAAQLDAAAAALSALEQATGVSALESFARAAQALSGVEWRLAERRHEALRAQAQRQTALIADYRNKLTIWQGYLRKLNEELSAAVLARAPVVREKDQQRRLEARVSQAERALIGQEYDLLTTALVTELDAWTLQATPSEERDLLARVRARREAALPYRRQADILLLQAPLESEHRFHYTVLLRTASEPGSHGINIQSNSTVVKQDRHLISALLGEITSAVDAGLVRQFQEQATVAIPPTTVATLEAATAESPPPEPAPPEGDGANELRFATAHRPRQPRTDFNSRILDMGDLMYRLFMPEQIQDYLIETPCSLTITTNDLELPWELMSYRDASGQQTFLCLDRPVARLPMGRAFPRLSQPLDDNKVRFLLIYADPTGNLGHAGREIEKIREALEAKWKDKINLQVDVLRLTEATGRALNERLRDDSYDVIHYAGHAFFEPDNPDLSGLLLHDGEHFFAQKIRRLLRGRPLVFLNACQTGRTANEQEAQQVNEYLQKPAEGLASAFIYGGALGCIGALWPIYDDPAAEFAITFYDKILEGYTLGESMRLARLDSRKFFPDSITWAAFVLYGDPTVPLVR